MESLTAAVVFVWVGVPQFTRVNKVEVVTQRYFE
jgi:hypothetical protein